MTHGSPWPKVLRNGQHVPGECRIMPAAAPAHQGTVLWIGCWSQAHVANGSQHASPFRGRNRKKAAVGLGGAVLGWRRRLQTWPYRVTSLLWAQHGFGRGSGNNTTSNNWQEHSRGPFQGHGRPALFLLHLGAGQTDLAGDGDSSSALLRVLYGKRGTLHHSPILCCGGDAMQEDSWLQRRQSHGHNGSSIQC